MKTVCLLLAIAVSPLSLFANQIQTNSHTSLTELALVQPETYSLDMANSTMSIEGTSNVHDWVSRAEEISGSAVIALENGALTSVSDLSLIVQIKGIKSGKKGMDSRTYDALQEKKHPIITFTLSEISSISEDGITATGELTIAGATQAVQMNVSYTVHEDGSLQFSGRQAINMRDYGIDPPTAMFGAISAGEEVQVVFDARFKQNS